jgi:hypothetical protein
VPSDPPELLTVTRSRALRGVILASALAVRLAGLGTGLPFADNPDEELHFVPPAARAADDLNPGYFQNPSALTYLLAAVFRVVYVGRDVTVLLDRHPGSVFLTARIVVALLGTLLVVLAYRAALLRADGRPRGGGVPRGPVPPGALQPPGAQRRPDHGGRDGGAVGVARGVRARPVARRARRRRCGGGGDSHRVHRGAAGRRRRPGRGAPAGSDGNDRAALSGCWSRPERSASPRSSY